MNFSKSDNVKLISSDPSDKEWLYQIIQFRFQHQVVKLGTGNGVFNKW